MKFTKLSALVLTAFLAMGMQITTLGTATAAADSDLALYASRHFANQSINYQACNNGPTPIKSITFSISATNFNYDTSLVSPFDTQPDDAGEIDHSTHTWTGLLAAQDLSDPENPVTQCASLITSGSETGDLGDSVTTTVRIVSSIQEDDTVNADSSGNETVVLDPYVIVELPDLKAESHLITTGDISPTTEVEYQVDVENIGDGEYHDNGFFIFAFTLPPDATFSDATDLNPLDALNASNSNCFPAGVLGTDIVLPGLGGFSGRRVVVCQLSITGGTLPADDTVYPFKIEIVAGASLAAGTADVVGILEGNDSDTEDLFQIIARGDDLLTVLEENPNDNFFHLDYDAEALQVTSALCPGQSEITTDGTGCFRLTFNKLIYAPSFTTDDIDLGGAGNISSFTQIDDFTWEIQVSGIAKGQELTLLLDLNEIQDYSAVQNSTQVLGVNTIRYADEATTDGSASGTTSANGTLAETGMKAIEVQTAFGLLALGMLLLAIARRKKVVL